MTIRIKIMIKITRIAKMHKKIKASKANVIFTTSFPLKFTIKNVNSDSSEAA